MLVHTIRNIFANFYNYYFQPTQNQQYGALDENMFTLVQSIFVSNDCI